MNRFELKDAPIITLAKTQVICKQLVNSPVQSIDLKVKGIHQIQKGRPKVNIDLKAALKPARSENKL